MIKFHKGSSRYVFELGPVVLKTPRPRPLSAASLAVETVVRYDISALKRQWQIGGNTPYSLKGRLAAGYYANLREREIAEEHPDVIVKTIGILGLVNIQKRRAHPPISAQDIRSVFADSMNGGEGMIGHELEDVENFGIDNGEVKFLDGGGKNLETCLDLGKSAVKSALERLPTL